MKKLSAGMAIATFAATFAAGSVGAGHGHYVVIEHPTTESTTCQSIGRGQTRIDDPSHGGYHRIHDNVHTGTPGTDGHGTTFDKTGNEGNHDDCVVRGG